MRDRTSNDPTKRPSKIKEQAKANEKAAARYKNEEKRTKFEELREEHLDQTFKK